MELDLGIVSIMDFYYYIDYPYNCINVFKQKVIINRKERLVEVLKLRFIGKNNSMGLKTNSIYKVQCRIRQFVIPQ